MTHSQDHVAGIVADILQGRSYRSHSSDPPRDFDDAYRLQDEVHERLSSGERGPIAGYKIAVNSAALLSHFGLQEPVSGRVYATQTSSSPARRRIGDYSDFAYEPEIAAIMGESISPSEAPVDRAQVIAAIDRFVPALELLDLRHSKPPEVHLPDMVAQNISNAGAVLGGDGIKPSDLEMEGITTTVLVSEQQPIEVTGAAPQDPVEAVTWLANHLAQRGIGLEAGQFVLCGTHIPMQPVKGPAEISVEMSGLGRVTLSLSKEDE